MDWALIGYISGGLATLATIATFISHQLKPKFKAAGQFWAHLVGVEENVTTGQERIPGLFEVIRDLKAQAGRMEDRLEERLDQQDGVLAKQDESLDVIRHELFPNSGGSLRDAVDRQGKQLNDHLRSCPPQAQAIINVHPQEHP